jgi:hypothetical protein
MKNKILRIGAVFLTVAVLLTGVVFPMTANAASPNSALHNIQGTVVSMATDNLSVVVQDGTQAKMTVKVDPNTRYLVVPVGKVNAVVNTQAVLPKKEMPKQNGNDKKGKEPPQAAAKAKASAHIPDNWKSNLGWLETFNSQGKFSDIQVGDRIIASVNNPNNIARQILIIKAPVIQTVKGIISAISGNSITITPASGPAVTVTVDAKTPVTLHGLLSVQVKQYATSVYNKVTLVARTLNVMATAPVVTPKGNLNGITVSSAVSGNLTIGANRLFTATGSYSNGSTVNISDQVNWASSNTAAATIDNTGSATGMLPGITNITAAKDGVTSPAVVLNVSTIP